MAVARAVVERAAGSEESVTVARSEAMAPVAALEAAGKAAAAWEAEATAMAGKAKVAWEAAATAEVA